jgi:uncharacterized protein YoxC
MLRSLLKWNELSLREVWLPALNQLEAEGKIFRHRFDWSANDFFYPAGYDVSKLFRARPGYNDAAKTTVDPTCIDPSPQPVRRSIDDMPSFQPYSPRNEEKAMSTYNKVIKAIQRMKDSGIPLGPTQFLKFAGVTTGYFSPSNVSPSSQLAKEAFETAIAEMREAGSSVEDQPRESATSDQPFEPQEATGFANDQSITEEPAVVTAPINEVVALEEQVYQLQQHLEERDRRVSDLEGVIEATNAVVRHREQLITDLNQQIDRMKQATTSEIAGLREEIASLRQQVRERSGKDINLLARIQSEQAQAMERWNELKAEMDSLENRREQLAHLLRDAMVRVDVLQELTRSEMQPVASTNGKCLSLVQ